MKKRQALIRSAAKVVPGCISEKSEVKKDIFVRKNGEICVAVRVLEGYNCLIDIKTQ